MSQKKLFALVMGIDEYPEGVSDLRGCVNDANIWKEFLETHYKHFSPEIALLSNEQASRAGVIDAFQKHLSQARDGDIIFLHYSGHGSREKAPEGSLKYFPEGLNETLVLSDSRHKDANGNYTGIDLADKELGRLLEDIIEGKPKANLVISLDCCHSGSGTRNVSDLTQPRLTGDRQDQGRSMESYLPGIFVNGQYQQPSSRHVLMAACTKKQQAWEANNREKSQKNGLFTYCMMRTFEKLGTNVTYADLYRNARAMMRAVTQIQEPQLEAYEKYNANEIFFEGTVPTSASKYSQKVKLIDEAWTLDFGAIHGMPNSRTVDVALYKNTADLLSQTVAGHAKATKVLADKTELELEEGFQADANAEYIAEFLSPVVPPLNVYVFADEQKGIDAVAQAAEESKSMYLNLIPEPLSEGYEIKIKAPDQMYFTEVSVFDKEGKLKLPTAGDYHLVIKEEMIYITDERNRLIQGASGAYKGENVQYMFDLLDDMAKWENLVKLQNPSPQLKPEDIEFVFYDQNGEAQSAEEIVINYKEENDEWLEVPFRLGVKNNTAQNLHFSLIYMSDSYEIAPLDNQQIDSKLDEATILEDTLVMRDYNEEGLPLAYDEATGQYVVNEQIQVFKLLVSTERLDDFTLQQEEIDIGFIHRTRGLGSRSKNPRTRKVQNDWFTKEITVKMVRQASKLSGEEVQLANNKIQIKGNKSVKANLNLSASNPGSRSTDGGSLIASLAEQQPGKMIYFGEEGLGENILEINNIEGEASLASEPLEIVLDESVDGENELILPLTFNGSRVLTVGDTEVDADGKALIKINEVPDQEESQSRSLGKALKLAFFKLTCKWFPVELYRLTWVEYKENDEIERHVEGITDKVAAAQKVLLVIHGIIGDTEEMAKCVKFAHKDHGGSYDLVLSFDYENLNSSVRDDISHKFKERLESAGFAADDGKELHILAHSMGGLVSRWMIEQREGNKMVDRLIMCGTPNGGSIFADVESYLKFVNIGLSVAIGSSLPVAPWLGGLMGVLKKAVKLSKKLMVSLAEMNKDSDFLRDLNSSPDPGIPYVVIAGDITYYQPQGDTRFAQFIDLALKGVGNYAYTESPNDIAVGVNEIKQTGNNASVEIYDIVCHHMNYFSEERSVKKLKEVL